MSNEQPLEPGTRIVRLGAVFFLDPTTHHESYSVCAVDRDGVWYRGEVMTPLDPSLVVRLLAEHSFVI